VNPTAKKGCIGCLGFIVLIWVIASLLPENPETKAQGLGGEGVVLIEGGYPVVLGVTEADLDAFTKASVAGDKAGVRELYLAGRIIDTPSNTRVKVIDRSTFRRKVRLMDGPRAGRAGWVPYEWVQPE